MNKNYIILLFVLLTTHCMAQTEVRDTTLKTGIDSTAKHISATDSTTDSTSFIKDLSIGFPDIMLAYCQPFRNASLRSLPAGDGLRFYPAMATAGGSILGCGMKLAGIYYKEKFGIELYYGEYGPSLQYSAGYNNYIAALFPSYYSFPNADLSTGAFYYFAGFLAGPVYKIQRKKYVITPKLLVGIVNDGYYDVTEYLLKEKGNNQFVTYDVNNTIAGHTHSLPSLHAELDMARKVGCRGKHIKCEMGIRLEYMVIPYQQEVTVTQQTNNGPIAAQTWSSRHVFQMVSGGVYWSLFYTKKHPVADPKWPYIFGKKKMDKGKEGASKGGNR